MADKLLIDAIAYALSREVVPSDDYYNRMSGIQRRQAVSIAGLAELDHVRYVMAQVDSALINGQSFDEFKRNVNLVDIDLPRHRLRTIYQTNIQQAYAHGRWTEQQRNKKDKPFLKRVEINDSRTRPEHKRLNGITKPIDDAFWQYYYAPDAYNCRGIMVGLTQDEAESQGITDSASLPDIAKSSGWGTPAQYSERFTNLVNDRISQTMLENIKQSSTIAKIGGKITGAIGKFLNKPTTKLAALIASARELLKKDDDE